MHILMLAALTLGAAPLQPAVTPQLRQCVTPAMAQHHFEASLAKAGNPPAATAASILADGRMVLSMVIMGNPEVLNMVFDGGCLVGSFTTPAP